jgi:hypothetical protein
VLDKNGQLASVVSYPNLTNTEIKKLRDDLTIKFYKSPKWIFQTLVRNNNPNEIIRLLKAAKDYLLYLFQKD